MPFKRASNPVVPTTFKRPKVKLNTDALSPSPSPQERVGQALAIAAAALQEASDALLGKTSRGRSIAGPFRACESQSFLTCLDLVNEFLLVKARAGRGDRYLRQLRVSLGNFRQGRARTQIDLVKPTDLEKWINAQEWAPKTQRNYLCDVRTMFNFAVRRGYLDRNPAAGVELPVLDGRNSIQIHAPEQVRQVLETARRVDLDVCRHLAIRYLAGVRTAEAHRMRETDLKMDHDLLEVSAAKSKTRARRLVTIQPNLRAWLELGGELRPLGANTVRNVIKLSKVEWPHNVARHSFVSYHLAQFGNAAKTAMEAGHTEQILFRNYRALVTPAVAAEYWNILPK